jgi:hypothetical protein
MLGSCECQNGLMFDHAMLVSFLPARRCSVTIWCWKGGPGGSVKCVKMRSNDQHLSHTNTHTTHNLKDKLYKFEGHSNRNCSDSRRQGMLSQEWSLKWSYFLYSIWKKDFLRSPYIEPERFDWFTQTSQEGGYFVQRHKADLNWSKGLKIAHRLIKRIETLKYHWVQPSVDTPVHELL